MRIWYRIHLIRLIQNLVVLTTNTLRFRGREVSWIYLHENELHQVTSAVAAYIARTSLVLPWEISHILVRINFVNSYRLQFTSHRFLSRKFTGSTNFSDRTFFVFAKASHRQRLAKDEIRKLADRINFTKWAIFAFSKAVRRQWISKVEIKVEIWCRTDGVRVIN